MADVSANSVSARSLVEFLVEEFIERRRAGEQVFAYDYLHAYPEHAAELASRLENAELLCLVAGLGGGPPPDPSGNLAAGEPPRSLHRYQIGAELGRGNYGVVFKAFDPQLKRHVALKLVRKAHDPSGQSAIRFQRDAQIAAKLRHPHIVPVHDFGEEANFCFLAMELIDGPNLKQVLEDRQGPLPWREAAQLVLKLAEALDYAHRQDIVHRDVKPSNILIDAHGEPLLADFGLARQMTGDETLTKEGQILGSPWYMSPEQAAGRAFAADGRSDVFSLGVVLYHLLTGQPPFEDPSIAMLLTKIIEVKPPAPRTRNAAIPHDLETICLKALEKAPADRFATAQAFADELRRCLNDEQIWSRRPSLVKVVYRWVRKNRLRLVLRSAVIAMMLLAGVLLYQWNVAMEREKLAKEREQAQQREQAEQQVWRHLEAAQSNLDDSQYWKRQALLDSIEKARAARLNVPPGPTTEALDVEIRSMLASHLAQVYGQRREADEALLARGEFYQCWRVAMRPDGKAMAIGTRLGPVLWIRGEELRLPDRLESIERERPGVAFSPDGRHLVLAPEKGGLKLYGEDLARERANLDQTSDSHLAFHFSPDRLQSFRADGQVLSWSLNDLKPAPPCSMDVKVVKGRGIPYAPVAFHPKGHAIAVGEESGQIGVYDTQNGRLLQQLPKAPDAITALDWSPDGHWLAAGTQYGDLLIIDADGNLLHKLPFGTLEVRALRFHPSRPWLAVDNRGICGLIDVAAGTVLTQLAGANYSFSRDGRCYAAGASDSVVFSDLGWPEVIVPLRGHRFQVRNLAWSGDSRRLASMDNRFGIQVWDVENARSIASLQAARAAESYPENSAIALSAHGQQLAWATSGGGNAVIHDLSTGKNLGDWPLQEGHERLAFVDGRFLHVRNEADPVNPQMRRSAVYELRPGLDPPVFLHELRRHLPEEWGYSDMNLTPDGKFFWWSGPRTPEKNIRVEVYETATGKKVGVKRRPSTHPRDEVGAYLSPDGRLLWTKGQYGLPCLLDEAPEFNNSRPAKFFPWLCSPDSSWQVTMIAGRHGRNCQLHRGDLSKPWLELPFSRSSQRSVALSPDGRRLAWCSGDGTIYVADLESLKKEVDRFERR